MVRRMKGVAGIIVGVVLAAAAAALARATEDRPAPEPRPAAALLERLLRVPSQVSVLQVSSHNKKGENGDANWPLYKDSRGDDVIFDAAGPGCIKSMWGTAFDPAATLQFYFDGESESRLRVNILDFYKGRHPLFPAPLVSYERRGNWGGEPLAGNSFVPVPFAKSLKISVKGESRFFHIISEKYPVTAKVSTFTGREDRAALLDAFAHMGEPLAGFAGLDARENLTEVVEPGTTVPLLKLDNAAGIIRDIVIEADGSEAFFQKTRLRMRWDGHTRWDVEAPPGVFFGSAVRADDVRTLPLRVDKLPGGKVRLSAFFPMPFWEKAEVEWANTSDRPMAPLKARISIAPNTVPRGEGTYFTTLYRAGETSIGRDWTLFEGRGTGWFVGAVQSMMHSHYCEGNEHFTFDGAVSPQFNGTGTEDYYLACFWPNVDFDTPFGGVAGDIQAEGGGDMAGAYHVPSS
jgi:D-arabinan exo alpha-(1,3)/(1,5)-arabinofuranosidase (non-reducing end)